jgi:hypothetical protein
VAEQRHFAQTKKERIILKNHFSPGNTRKTLKHSAFLERLFNPLRMMAVPA